MNATLCDKEAQNVGSFFCSFTSKAVSLSLSLSHSLFAAYAVIANGQVECPKGFKRMNLTHCQGKLQHMFENVSAGIENTHLYFFYGRPLHKNKTSIQYRPMNTNLPAVCVQVYTNPWGWGHYKTISFCTPGPRWEPGQDYN